MSTTSQPVAQDATAIGDAPRPSGGFGALIVTVVLVLALGTGMFLASSPQAAGLLALALMLVMIAVKVPIGIALAVPAILGLWAVSGFSAAAGAMTTVPYETVASWELSVLPMFVFMGLLLWRSGTTARLYEAASSWLSWLPGGLAVGTNFAGAGLAAVSGSTAATTYALGRIGIPEMLRAGYHRRLAVGSVIVAGIGGQIMPPSVLLVVYAGIAGVAVGPQLLAGVIPGFVLPICFGAMIVAMAIFRRNLVRPRDDEEGLPAAQSKFRALLSVWPLPALTLLIIGGILSGVVTATEAGAAGALGAFLITLWGRRSDTPFRAVRQCVSDTVTAVGGIFILLIGGALLSRLLAVSRLGAEFADAVAAMELSRTEFLFGMVLVYLVMGMFMDPLAMMLLTVPVLVPILHSLDISLLWFGVFAVFMGEIAVVTPPVGILAYILYNITQDPEVNQGQEITLSDVFASVAWFLPICVVFAVLLILFPEIATFLPDAGG